MRNMIRALSFFRADWLLISVWLVMIAAQIGLGLLMPWPLQVMIDSVLQHAANASDCRNDLRSGVDPAHHVVSAVDKEDVACSIEL